MKKLCVSLLGLISATTVSAEGFDINLSKETASVNYLFNASQLSSGGADASVGVFYSDRDDMDVTIANGKVLVTGNIQGADQYLKFGVGAKVGAGRARRAKDSIGYLGLGARLGYLIPSASVPMGVFAEAFYAPKITSFGDVEEVVEVTAGFEAEVAPSAKGYIGYRFLNVEVEGGGDVDLDKSAHLGVMFEF